MLRFTVITVGKIRRAWLRDGIEEYENRLKHFAKISTIQISSPQSTAKPSASQIQAVIQAESQAMLARWNSNSYSIALSPQGRQLGSKGLAELIQNKSVAGNQHFTFFIGSSHGLSQEIINHCQSYLSFGKNTFPHQMFRLILFEQLYRASTIITGTAYHK